MTQQTPSLCLALGGGAARGIAHIGILQRLEDVGVTINAIAATSAGALIGALYAAGVSPYAMTDFALSLKWLNLFFPAPTLSGLVSTGGLVKLLRKYCPVSRFEELRIPLAVMVTEFETGSSVALTEGDLLTAVQASCSIPILCRPVKLNGRYYMDGGVVAELPVKAAKMMGKTYVVACDVHHNTTSLKRPRHLLAIGMHLGRIVAQTNANAVKPEADLVISVDVSGIALTDLHKGKELIQRGRDATDRILPELQKLMRST
jgi:NTE family protein